MSATKKMQYELQESRVAQLKQIMETCGFATQKELLNNALALFEWAVRQREQGRTIASVNEEEGKWKELSMPSLDHISGRAAASHPVMSTRSR